MTTTTPPVERPRQKRGPTVDAGPAAEGDVVRLAALRAQITVALEQMPSDTTATIRVQHGQGQQPALVAAEVWTIPAVGGVARRVCDLPAAVGLRIGLVEETLDKTVASYPRADLGLRARWRRLIGFDKEHPTHELVVSLLVRATDTSQESDHG